VSLSDPLQDERLKKTFEAEGVEEGLYNGAKAELMTEKREFSNMARRVALLETLENRYVFPLPQVMIDAEKKQILEGASRGSFEGLETEESLEKMARRRVALAFLFLNYGRVHNIQVSNQDLAQAIFKDVDGDKKQFAKAVEFLKNNQQQLVALKNNILEDKVIDALLENIAGSTRYILFRDFLLERQAASLQTIKNSAE
jgi:trigger factor